MQADISMKPGFPSTYTVFPIRIIRDSEDSIWTVGRHPAKAKGEPGSIHRIIADFLE